MSISPFTLMKQLNEFKSIMKDKSVINQSLLEYLGISTNEIGPKAKKKEKAKEIYQILGAHFVLTNKCEFRDFLETVSHLWEQYQSKTEIKRKIENLFITIKKDIKNIFSQKEIFNIFHFNKNFFILLILVEQNILSIETIINNIDLMNLTKDWRIVKYFYLEIRKYDGKYFNKLMKKNEDLQKFVEEKDKDPIFFNKIRKAGEEEPKIIELIREDKIDEFISLIEQSPIDLNNKIQSKGTIFETDTPNLTPIEYSILFGSITIFKLLYMAKVNITIAKENDDNIIKYAIHGRNLEILSLLSGRVEIRKELDDHRNHHKYLKETIKIHNNEIFDYFITEYCYKITDDIIMYILACRNYQLFNLLIERNQINIQNNDIISFIFSSICKSGNEDIAKLLINQPNLNINYNKIVLNSLIRNYQKSQENNQRRKRKFIVIDHN